MYEVDDRDRVVELTAVPQSAVGAPLPVVLADEHHVLLAYLAHEPEPDWDGTSVRVVDFDSAEPVVVVTFERPTAHMFGPPNDEAFDGHPLASRGLSPYAAFRIDESSWIRRLERMNHVHAQHRPESFATLSHFVFAFHDSTFECVARGFSTRVTDGPLSDVTAALVRALAES